jgi:hypothetical protein
MKVIKAIYDFIVGDMLILFGVLITVVVLSLIHSLGFLALLRPFAGFLLILAVLLILIATLSREAFKR